MDEKGLKIFLAVLQSIIVILLVYFLSFVRETEIERSFDGYTIPSPLFLYFILVPMVTIFLKEGT